MVTPLQSDGLKLTFHKKRRRRKGLDLESGALLHDVLSDADSESNLSGFHSNDPEMNGSGYSPLRRDDDSNSGSERRVSGCRLKLQHLFLK